MPKALVATMTSASSSMNRFWFSVRSAGESPAWYAAAEKPCSCRNVAVSSTSRRVAQYTMPLSRRCAATNDAMRMRLAFGFICSTEKRRFGRSNPVTTTSGSVNPARRTMSSRTSSVAVAVSAMTGGRAPRATPYASMNSRISR